MRRILLSITLLATIISCSTTKKTAKDVVSFTAEDAAIYNDVQRRTFEYFWSGAEPNSGLARERFHEDNDYPANDKHIVTSGGGGFGVMAILSGINQHYITREQGRKRLDTIVDFLARADRFHGAWSHWINGETGKVKPFGSNDDGGDLVESSFMLTGLLCVRQYFKDGSAADKALAAKCDKLWKEVDFNWYRNGKNVLYWHWSPNVGWKMNFAVTGYNECLIMYILAASSPTHGVPAQVYHEGWARSGKINDSTTKYGHTLRLSHNGAKEYGGPLFWAHYSYLGLDPRGLKDRYADYWNENVNQTLINHDWCVDNPKKYKGYGADSWGLTAGYSKNFYAAHAPSLLEDRGIINPTAALSSMPYTPEYSMAALRNWYNNKRNTIYGGFGFYDGFSDEYNWVKPWYLAIDQGPTVVMMENYRSHLLWDLFMSCPEIQSGLKKLDFTSPQIK